jgi:hypothetical protein
VSIRDISVIRSSIDLHINSLDFDMGDPLKFFGLSPRLASVGAEEGSVIVLRIRYHIHTSKGSRGLFRSTIIAPFLTI